MARREKDAAAYIKGRAAASPRVGIILGSGLGAFAESAVDGATIPYSEIPGFPTTSIDGHEGNLVVGKVEGRHLAILQGRVHCYEGFAASEAAFPVRALHELGVETLVVTCAAGGIADGLAPGSLMAVSDHINLMGDNPLRGIGTLTPCPSPMQGRGVKEMLEGRDRFVDMSGAYDTALLDAALEAGRGAAGLHVQKGVLAAVLGPSYETPAEIRMLRALGADAVTMSTVPEVITARFLGMRVLAVALITNRAAGLSEGRLSHEEVVEAAHKGEAGLSALMRGILRGLS